MVHLWNSFFSFFRNLLNFCFSPILDLVNWGQFPNSMQDSIYDDTILTVHRGMLHFYSTKMMALYIFLATWWQKRSRKVIFCEALNRYQSWRRDHSKFLSYQSNATNHRSNYKNGIFFRWKIQSQGKFIFHESWFMIHNSRFMTSFIELHIICCIKYDSCG